MALLAEALGLRGDGVERFHRLARNTAAAPSPTDADPPLGEAPDTARRRPVSAAPIGRAGLIDHVSAALLDVPAITGGPRLVVLAGGPGSGKTAVATHVAAHLRDHFPDGQYYVDAADADPELLVDRVSRSFGIEPACGPATFEDRAMRLRAVLRDRRALLVLDNVFDEAQLRPLLAADDDAACAIIAVSWRRLSAIVGVRTIPVPPLDPGSAADLFIAAGRRPVNAGDRDTIAWLTLQCDHLPLAVWIAGTKAADRPHISLQRQAERLRQPASRLNRLVVGDRSVRASFGNYYRRLDPPQQRAFRLMGTVDVPSFPAWAAAATLDVPLDEAEELLDRLVETNLFEVAGTDETGTVRYRLPSLLRAFAQEVSQHDDSAKARRSALRRAVTAWYVLSEIAERALSGSVPRPAIPIRLGGHWAVTDLVQGDPTAWLRSERQALSMVLRQAGRAGIAMRDSDTPPAGRHVRTGQHDDHVNGHTNGHANGRVNGHRRAHG
ncbi:ATP-binding protein [Amycolatopsis sp. A133]|uniref:ATP-binding protein n=1 Tax=Amycolatopsis sp. A133 TaxID=3064472 RepID=UPI0027F8065D|nr:ATP-binding protein [Amycolatopsis sp. A133]MDQ7807609.1 ATP-binding protein [Amycolatopsis sp. A133]